MSKHIKPWRPLLFCSAQPTAFTARMPSDHMDTAQPSELACLPQEPRVTMRHKISYSYKTMFANCRIPKRTLEDTYALLQQTELLAGVINEQDCRAIRTACCCLKSLRIRVEARANVTEGAVISRQLQLMQASVQHYLQRTSTQLIQVARPGPRLNTSITDVVVVQKMNARIPVPMWLSQQHGQPTALNTIDCNACIC